MHLHMPLLASSVHYLYNVLRNIIIIIIFQFYYYYFLSAFIIIEKHETRQYTNGINAHTELLLILSLIYYYYYYLKCIHN